MAQLLAEQTAENAKSVDQGKPGVQAQTTVGIISDKDALFQFSKSVLMMQSRGCHIVAEQLMASEGQEAVQRSLSNAHHERKRMTKKSKQSITREFDKQARSGTDPTVRTSRHMQTKV